MKNLIPDFLGYIIIRALSILFFFMPLRLALWIGRRIGDSAYLLNSKRRAIAYANLKSAFPEKAPSEIKKTNRVHFQNIGMSIIELLKLPAAGKRYLNRYVKIKNLDRIRCALKKGKGVILLTGHFGNWEISSIAASARGYRMSVFAREQKYPRLNNLLNRIREMTGCTVVTKGFSVRDIIKTLSNNGIVGMLSDQDAGAGGVFVNFLNRPASTAAGAVSFSLKTGAVILPSFVRRVSHIKHEAVIEEPLELVSTQDKDNDLRVNLEKISRILEGHIRRFPSQWLWSHKRWKTTPYRSVLVLSDGKAGHFNQAMAVASMIEEALGLKLRAKGIAEKPIVKVNIAEVKFKNRFFRMLLDISSIFSGRRCQGCLRCMKVCLKEESFRELRDAYADIIISCGAATSAANIFLGYENNARNIVIMKPGFGRMGKFDLVILPRHDMPLRIYSNILIIEAAPNRITPGIKKRNRGIGLLIGGDTKKFKLKRQGVEKVIDSILRMANEMDCDIFATTSRRTSAEIDKLIKERLEGNKRCRLLVIANECNREGVVQEILNQSDVAIVSPESISMISEAISSQRYVLVFKDEGQEAVGRKHRKAIDNLEQGGHIKIIAADKIYDEATRLLIEKPAIKVLEDRKNIIRTLSSLI